MHWRHFLYIYFGSQNRLRLSSYPYEQLSSTDLVLVIPESWGSRSKRRYFSKEENSRYDFCFVVGCHDRYVHVLDCWTGCVFSKYRTRCAGTELIKNFPSIDPLTGLFYLSFSFTSFLDIQFFVLYHHMDILKFQLMDLLAISIDIH